MRYPLTSPNAPNNDYPLSVASARGRLGRPLAGALLLALLLCLAGLGGLGRLTARATEPPPAHSDLLLVGLEADISPAAAESIFAEAGLIPARHWPEFALAAARLPADDERNREARYRAARSRLALQPGVRYVETDWAIEAASHPSPNDPYYPEQWALQKINMPEAWDATVGDPRLVVALIDSGLAVEHEDLAGLSLWVNELEAGGRAGEDDDANGYVDDINGWDWVAGDNTFEDPYGHGTHVGGILAARTDNGIGVASVGRTLTLMPLRVLDDRGSGFISYLVDALAYARRKGAQIVNLSLVLRIDSLAISDSVRAYVATGGLIVAATGNYGTQVYWPAAYSETLAVAATSRDDSRSPFSNRGPETDLAAPGSLIVSTYRDNGYYLNDGTSMAVPHVSALAALVWSLRPDWNWQQVANHLKATAADVNAQLLPGPDDELGAGRIDAAAALAGAGAGVTFTVDYLAGQYTTINQPLQIPLRLTVTDTQGALLPVVGGLIHYDLFGSPELAPGAIGPSAVLSGWLTSDGEGRAFLNIRMPEQVGRYDLSLRIAGQERNYSITLQDGPLVLAAQTDRPVLTVGGESTPLIVSAHTGSQGQPVLAPLRVELTTTLGVFSDGSQRRSLWMVGGILTESLTSGTEAGVAEIGMSAAGQSQRTFVTVRPDAPRRMDGPARLVVQDWGKGTSAPIGLELRDRFGNPIWGNVRVNFYTLESTFAPQSPGVVLGRVQTTLALPAWLPSRVNYWAIVPGTFSIFQGDVTILRHHIWLSQLSGGPGAGGTSPPEERFLSGQSQR